MRNVALYATDPQSTRPIFLIDFGAEQFSTSGDQGAYLGGVVTLKPSADWRQIALSLPATADRTAAALAGTWRALPVTVQLVPATEYASVLEAGYVEQDYANNGVIFGSAITVFSGAVDSGQIVGAGQISYIARHRLLSKASIPGLRFGAPINYHCPPAGMVIPFKSTLYTLKGKYAS